MSQAATKPVKRRRKRRVASRHINVKLSSDAFQAIVDTLLETLHKAKDARAKPGLRKAVRAMILSDRS